MDASVSNASSTFALASGECVARNVNESSLRVELRGSERPVQQEPLFGCTSFRARKPVESGFVESSSF